MQSGFLEKLIERLDKLDPKSLQAQFLRLMQERGLLETIFQSIQEGVVVVDADGRLTYTNKAAETLIGLSVASSRGKPIMRYIREIDWDRILRLEPNEWSRMISHEIEVTYPQHRFINFYVVPLAAGSETQRGAVIILRDVTRDRQNEMSTIETERINAIKLLAAGVAHEIGNPLNALTIHLQLMGREMDRLEESQRGELPELLGIARNEVARLDMIITQFLRAIRPAKLKPVLTRLESLIEETLSLLRQEVQDRAIAVELVCPAPVPRIRVDRDQIKQCFFNIIRNAMQAMQNGGRLEIRVSASDHYVAIAFHDTGKGIEPEEMGRIFDPYFTTKQEGSGLGLMIVQRIIQDHGGILEVASKPGEGTRFTLSLPLAERRIRLLNASMGAAGEPGFDAPVPEKTGEGEAP